jgi:hypothetical protein
VTVTFDVWGNRSYGLRGYNITGIAVGLNQLRLYDSETGGFHGDPHHGGFDSRVDELEHPEVYRFPLDIFR